jgi:CheY-like chemotaxis protein
VTAWDRPEEHDFVVVIADDDPLHLTSLCERLAATPGRARIDYLGRYPRYRVIPAADGEEALRRVNEEVSVAAIDLVMPRRAGIEVIQELRMRRTDLAILAFTAGAPPSEAVAAVMAGADYFHEYRDQEDTEGFERALDLAIDRRRLTRLIERNEAEVVEARDRLSKLSGDLASSLPGFRPPQTAETVIPFNEAAQRYLIAAARIFDGDPRGLADRLGISYFALRRLLKRYGVPFPGRSRKSGTPKG